MDGSNTLPLLPSDKVTCSSNSFNASSTPASAGSSASLFRHHSQNLTWRLWNDSGTADGKANETAASDRCYDPVPLETDQYTVTILGIVSPALVLLTLVTNCLVCVVLLKPHMRNCTNALLVAMAVSDTLTGVMPVPCFLYLYTTGSNRNLKYLPYNWCFAYYSLTDYLPTICHTASVWLTVALAAHRYVYVCHPGRAKRLCTMSNVLRTIGVIYVTAAASQLCRFAEHQYHPVEIQLYPITKTYFNETTTDLVDSNLFAALTFPTSTTLLDHSGRGHGSNAEEGSYGRWDNASLVDSWDSSPACCFDFSPLVRRYEHVYFNVYYWFRIICIHLVPCTTLVVLNAALIGAIRSAKFRRLHLLLLHNQHQHQGHRRRDTERQRSSVSQLQPKTDTTDPTGSDDVDRRNGRHGGGDCNPFRRLRRRRSVSARAAHGRRSLDAGSSTTLMLVIVVGVFLLVEFPLAILFIIITIENTFDVPILTPDTHRMSTLVLNLVTLVSYPVNFFIYCAMSEQFRRTFYELFVAARRRDDNGGDGGGGEGEKGGTDANEATMTTGRSCCGGMGHGWHNGGRAILTNDGPRPFSDGVEEVNGDESRQRSSHNYVSLLPMKVNGRFEENDEADDVLREADVRV